jgi:hypothetical protein
VDLSAHGFYATREVTGGRTLLLFCRSCFFCLNSHTDRVDLDAHGFYATSEVTGNLASFVCCKAFNCHKIGCSTGCVLFNMRFCQKL